MEVDKIVDATMKMADPHAGGTYYDQWIGFLGCENLQLSRVTVTEKRGELTGTLNFAYAKHGNPQRNPSNGLKVDGDVQRLGFEEPIPIRTHQRPATPSSIQGVDEIVRPLTKVRDQMKYDLGATRFGCHWLNKSALRIAICERKFPLIDLDAEMQTGRKGTSPFGRTQRERLSEGMSQFGIMRQSGLAEKMNCKINKRISNSDITNLPGPAVAFA